ncbi:hypothetical protein HanIR_Chr12g0566261 [Helianthus annuus]|nr:hypothetical protein HanIR_Chr12g0566261 [Helianthus annuus]
MLPESASCPQFVSFAASQKLRRRCLPTVAACHTVHPYILKLKVGGCLITATVFTFVIYTVFELKIN